MLKLIKCPDECAFCDRTDNYRDIRCKNPKTRGSRICNDPNRFPPNCPLKEGISIKNAFKIVAKARVHCKQNKSK
jgi:hypothetical protein